MLNSLDKFMQAHPWHPRVVPFVVYVGLLFGVGFARDFDPRTVLVTYPLMCLATAYVLWRYRDLTPELNWRFHWLALPVSVAAVAAWIVLGMAMEKLSPWFVHEGKSFFTELGEPLGWAAMIMRVLGMAIVVPMFEELFFRSAMLRSFHSPRAVWIAAVQFAEDLPVIGDKVLDTKVSKEHAHVTRPLEAEFNRVGLGQITLFSVIATSLLWAPISHVPRDWPGTWVCGVLFALLVAYTNRGGRALGLGPVIWAHGLTNALLWGWTLWADDWRFL